MASPNTLSQLIVSRSVSHPRSHSFSASNQQCPIPGLDCHQNGITSVNADATIHSQSQLMIDPISLYTTTSSTLPTLSKTYSLNGYGASENGTGVLGYIGFRGDVRNARLSSVISSGGKLRTGSYKKSKVEANATLSGQWIERVFLKRECIKFIPSVENSDRCGCGRPSAMHSQLALSRFTTSVTRPTVANSAKKWAISEHTSTVPTDAYGTVEFQGGIHAHKAQYIRLAFDTDPADVMDLMEKVWKLQRPRLVITVHGGMTNFDIQEKLGRVFREGLLKAAETTGAWVLTSGLDSGVVRHVARALDEAGISARMRSRVVTVGIAPWGLLQRRDKLIGMDASVSYDKHNFGGRQNSRRYAVLNDRHSYFLLADNGTVGRYGADIVLRKRFEEFLAQKQTLSCDANGRRIPIVCVALEGGVASLNSIYQYLSGKPSIPVIICEGSGRISDLIAFAERNVGANGEMAKEVQNHLKYLIRETISSEEISAELILERIVKCVQYRNLLTVFRLQEQDSTLKLNVDHVILRALLTGQNLSAIDQLSLTLAWNRVDIARVEVFSQQRSPLDWSPPQLYHSMMDALLLDRIEFVQLFLENGVSLKKFLTIERLEQLYNAEPEHLSTLSHLIGERRNSQGQNFFTLPEIGVAIEKLMGNAYRCTYTTRAFRLKYDHYTGHRKGHLKRCNNLSNLHLLLGGHSRPNPEQQTTRKRGVIDHQRTVVFETTDDNYIFAYPFNDLMLWAVLTRRHAMAKCIWQYGEEAMAKALTAIRLYKCMSKEAADDYTEVEVSNHLREFANEFRECSLELLNHCYQQDDMLTMKLLTTELPNWGHHTCLSLAVIANNKRFLAHPCCQILLAELWHGGLRFRSQSNAKVVLGILFPPSILLLDSKTSGRQKYDVDTKCSNECSNTETNPKRRFSMSKKKASFFAHCQNQLKHKSTTTNNESNGLASPSNTNRTNLESATGCEEEEESGGSDGERNDLLQCDKFHRDVCDDDAEPENCFEDRQQNRQRIRSLKTHLSNALAKFVLFYRAPITSFWVWSISFVLFMLTLIYVLLIEFPNEVTWIEWFLFVYILALALEHFRKLFILESSSLLEKVRVFYNRYWNILTTVAVVTYFIGFAFRFNAPTIHTYSRVILATNSVLWHMKLFDFLSVHPRIGPYITMAGKMVLAMSYIIIMLMVTLMAFGVARQSITFPHEKWNWILVRNIFYKPYFMLYGEVYAGEIDTCGDEGTNCVPGGWIPPVLMTIFLIVANILLINMLIAIFNNIFNVTNAMSQQVWLFQRYEQVMEYKSTPILPPPLTPLIHLAMLFKYAFTSKQCSTSCNTNAKCSQNSEDFALKVFLEPSELKKLHDFEEDCMDDLSRRKIRLEFGSHQLCAHKPSENHEEFYNRVTELTKTNQELQTQLKCLTETVRHFELSNQTTLRLLLQKPISSAVIHRKAQEIAKPENQIQRPTQSCVKRVIPSAKILPIPTSNFFISRESSTSDQSTSSAHSQSPETNRPPREEQLEQSLTTNLAQNHERCINFGLFEAFEDDEINEQSSSNNVRSFLSSGSCLHKNSVSLTEDLEQMYGVIPGQSQTAESQQNHVETEAVNRSGPLSGYSSLSSSLVSLEQLDLPND